MTSVTSLLCTPTRCCSVNVFRPGHQVEGPLVFPYFYLHCHSTLPMLQAITRIVCVEARGGNRWVPTHLCQIFFLCSLQFNATRFCYGAARLSWVMTRGSGAALAENAVMSVPMAHSVAGGDNAVRSHSVCISTFCQP